VTESCFDIGPSCCCLQYHFVQSAVGLNSRRPLLPSSGPNGCNLIKPLFAHLLSGTLLRQSLLHPALRSRLQVIGVALHFLNNVFRLNLALETTAGVFYLTRLLAAELLPNSSPPSRSKNRRNTSQSKIVGRVEPLLAQAWLRFISGSIS
jgi:hypothetical protein